MESVDEIGLPLGGRRILHRGKIRTLKELLVMKSVKTVNSDYCSVEG